MRLSPPEQPAIEAAAAPGHSRRPSLSARLLFALTLVQMLAVFAQAAFAGQFLSGNGALLAWHRQNATYIGLIGLAQLVVALVVWRRRGPAWPAAFSALLYAAVALQIRFGYSHRLAVHVPLGVAIFGLTVALVAGTGRLARRAAGEVR